MTAVKICGLTRPEDARAAAAAGADMIGLVFAPSPRQVTPARARRIIAVLPVHIVRVGVFLDQDADWVAGVADELGLDRLQFHGTETAAYLRQFTRARVIRALRPRANATAPRRDPAPAAAAVLIDACVPNAAGGTGQPANWNFARGLQRLGKPLILAGGLNPANVAAAIHRVRPDAVDVSSGVETRPGIKNAAQMRAFVQAVKNSAR